MKLEPLLNRVVIEPEKPAERSAGGVYIPDVAKGSKNEPWRGKVVAAGPGLISSAGARQPMHVAQGDIVLFNPYGVNEFEIDGRKVFIVPEGDILAVLRGHVA